MNLDSAHFFLIMLGLFCACTSSSRIFTSMARAHHQPREGLCVAISILRKRRNQRLCGGTTPFMRP